ncbi:MAG: amino acid ABC transporter substrate-binding protein [Rhodocyclales bacterium]|nr:amino acid ABC transporter substrate-binding protein [Rhodocyclales bacterium]
MNIFARWRLLSLLLALLASLPAVQAQGVTKSTLDRIREHGAIYVGHRETAIPFSYMIGNDVVGYTMDLCDRIVDAVREKSAIPTLKVVRVPVTGSSRMLMLLTGAIDLECGVTTNTKIRQQMVAFSFTTFVSGVKAMVRTDVGIDRIPDLAGKVVVTTVGTTTDRLVNSVMTVRGITIRAKSAPTQEAFSMVLSRQADAFVMDDAILSGFLASSPDRPKLKLLEENFGFEPYGIALRKDDPDFKKLIDDTLSGMMKSGEMERIYNKWFMSPIPPKNINLQIPMSGMLKELFRSPNDTGI